MIGYTWSRSCRQQWGYACVELKCWGVAPHVTRTCLIGCRPDIVQLLPLMILIPLLVLIVWPRFEVRHSPGRDAAAWLHCCCTANINALAPAAPGLRYLEVHPNLQHPP